MAGKVPKIYLLISGGKHSSKVWWWGSEGELGTRKGPMDPYTDTQTRQTDRQTHILGEVAKGWGW